MPTPKPGSRLKYCHHLNQAIDLILPKPKSGSRLYNYCQRQHLSHAGDLMLPVKRKRSLTFLEGLAPSFIVFCLAKYLMCVNSIQSHLLGPVQPVLHLYPRRPSAHQPREVNQSDCPHCQMRGGSDHESLQTGELRPLAPPLSARSLQAELKDEDAHAQTQNAHRR